jgi:4'-phosphopantetheinyl transferase
VTPLEIPCISSPATLPALRPWSQNASNGCIYDRIPVIWESYDIITFLADLGMYHPSLYDVLDPCEKEQEQKLRTEYFKKRFVISRSILKHIIHRILGAGNQLDIILDKKEKGRIIIPGIPDIFISLSYSGPLIAITVGKQKIGSDIEVIRPVRAKKITSCPILRNTCCINEKERLTQVIQVWTMVESYAKLYDTNPYPLLNTCSFFYEANFVSYCINQRAIFTLVSGQEQFTDTLVWLNTLAL